jgi:hypothetical protein
VHARRLDISRFFREALLLAVNVVVRVSTIVVVYAVLVA